MSVFSAVLLAIIAAGIGLVLGWSAHSSLSSHGIHPAPQASPPANDPTAGRADYAHAIEPQLAPLRESMNVLHQQISSLQERQAETRTEFGAHMQTMLRTSARLHDHTAQLTNALRNPTVRGRWGEVQLERVVELAGMVKHVDFDTQVSISAQGARLRPDMLIHLSHGREIVVDSKVPYSAYLDALETTDPEDQAGYMRRHAHLLRTHIAQLASKDYHAALPSSPEFVVLFLPADPFLDCALSVDPDLIEFAFSRDVVLATPTTLMALLRTVALGWQQRDISEQAAEIHRLGDELYHRLAVMNDHLGALGGALDKAVSTYNSTVASFDSRVAVTARKLHETYSAIHEDRTMSSAGEITTTPTRPRHARPDH